MKRLLILGATGLVGGQLLQQALVDPRIDSVTAPTRRPLPGHPKLRNPVVDYAELPAEADWWNADAVACALGTTLNQAGSQAAFRTVDHHYVLAAATLAHQAGTPAFVLNSSLGASLDAGSFYLRVKGEIERDLAALGFASLTIVRPSLLDGGPRPDSRPAESLALALSRMLGPLVPRSIRPVTTERVAACMLRAVHQPAAGITLIESRDIHDTP
ncbi:NAD(P)H-binding protein [Chitinimonas sp. BJYL2]|uniref:NAD(P)H-binding protein n=1 Tax=Chitinimonas sp. BJYL2 TaxID=2976696 RepID=UPI0022B58058|nr:NAD(P)H-binding protein [Chitinimonas sp. BJYL2]